MAILGLDVGDKRIGVSLADGLLAIPLTVIDRTGEGANLEQLLALAREHGVERIVVGLPLSMNGSIGRQAEKVISFSRALSKSTNVPIDTWDERLSTVAAERQLLDAGLKRGKRRMRRDATAAAIILQAYLDRIGK